MKQLKIILPAMGEGIFEATITQWLVNEGDSVNEDDSLVEIATDKVDSEVPAPTKGKVSKILIANGEVAKVGEVIAWLEIAETDESSQEQSNNINLSTSELAQINTLTDSHNVTIETSTQHPSIPFKLSNGVFLSPLVRSIAHKENISVETLNTIKGTGQNGRINKDDIIAFLKNKTTNTSARSSPLQNNNFQIIEMDRVRKLIAENMLRSKQTAPHVTSFHEVDVTNMVNWRNKNKTKFEEIHKQKITYTPIFIDALIKAIQKYPLINISVDGTRIIKKNSINIGMATALPDGNLIVPVIHNASSLSQVELASKVNDIAFRARNKKLIPAEITGGTITITNVGSFGNLSGTPIINQPEVAILAVGAIKKRPAVIETPEGDFIGIRHQLILSLSYDHRVVDGALGGMFLKQIADNIEAFNGKDWL